ncbi:sodium-dependent glucose transporter 1-like isoform X2 [Ruditapes philippinarum]|uniref:sodium-dependent glucose transporter 1-like isoform X2 n=1 Tax=Ruditapes philippinarum TaxID=129788 RepID=UPI00295A8365|nr:sodium-dependent glucose transporter 1-like isoform X2 [Ruditapes philippinarum]
MLSCENDSEHGSESNTDDNRSEDTYSLDKFIRKLRTDKVYRRTVILTLVVFWSYVILGWVVLQIGTALPDLQLLADVDLETASWLFTTWSLGFMTGSLFCGFLYDRINRLVVMFVCTFGVGICSIFLPHSKSFSMMLVLRVACGIFCGGIDTGANTIVPSIWGEKGGPFMQALYLSYTVGSIAVPFATEPFMSAHHHVVINGTKSFQTYGDNNTGAFNLSICTVCNTTYNDMLSLDNNQSSVYNHTVGSMFDKNISNESLASNILKDDIQIHNAFIMTCVLVLCSSFPYLVMVLIGDFDIKANIKTVKDVNTEKEIEPLREKSEIIVVIETGSRKIEGKRKYCVLACIAGVNLLYSATEDSLGDFIVSFALDFLHWDTSSAVSLISMYWVASCIGGLAGVFLVRCFRTTKLIFIAHLLWISTFLLSLIASLYRINIMIWIFIPSSGFFMVLIIPAAISWTEENVCHITGRISSLFMIATGTGLAANPRFLGYMMEEHTYVSFLYILFIESVICFGFYVLAYTARYFRYKSDDDVKATLRK